LICIEDGVKCVGSKGIVISWQNPRHPWVGTLSWILLTRGKKIFLSVEAERRGIIRERGVNPVGMLRSRSLVL
jgi:hypothetical protein